MNLANAIIHSARARMDFDRVVRAATFALGKEPFAVRRAYKAKAEAEAEARTSEANPAQWAREAREAATEAVLLARKLRRNRENNAGWERIGALLFRAARCAGYAQRDMLAGVVLKAA